jgi:hypothetical protein
VLVAIPDDADDSVVGLAVVLPGRGAAIVSIEAGRSDSADQSWLFDLECQD